MRTLVNFSRVLVLGLGAAAVALPASAIPYGPNTVYKVGNTVFVSAPASSQVEVGLGDVDRNGAKLAGSCGEVRVSPPRGGQLETVTVGTRTINATTLPVQLLPRCQYGQFEEARTTDFKTSAGQVVAVGFSPGQAVTVAVPTARTRRASVNACGFATLRNASGTLTIASQDYEVATLPDAGEPPVCRTSNGVSTGYVPSSWP